MILFDGNGILESGSDISRSFIVGKDERVELKLVALGGGNAELNLDITGPGADVRLRGLYVCGESERLRIKVNLTHSAGGSVSDQLFKGIVYGKARADFDGLIKVVADAQKTEAYQTNRNLQLSEDASVQTSPQLEIYADDVKCSHGATVGALSEDEQFYMRSRGISVDEARRLQMISFLTPVMEGLDTQIRETVLDTLGKIEL